MRFLISEVPLYTSVNSGVVIDSGTSLGEVPRELTMLKEHLPRVIYHQVYWYMTKKSLAITLLCAFLGSITSLHPESIKVYGSEFNFNFRAWGVGFNLLRCLATSS